MTEITRYQCDICSEVYEYSEEAERCESAHRQFALEGVGIRLFDADGYELSLDTDVEELTSSACYIYVPTFQARTVLETIFPGLEIGGITKNSVFEWKENSQCWEDMIESMYYDIKILERIGEAMDKDFVKRLII